MHKSIVSHRNRIEALFDKVAVVEDAEMQSEWAKYLCVLTSGYLEHSVRTILIDFAESRSHGNVTNYVDKQLYYFNNPKAGKIEEVFRSFNPSWARQVNEALSGDLKDAINSIVSNRHLISHGRDVDLSFIRMKEFYERTNHAIGQLHEICNP